VNKGFYLQGFAPTIEFGDCARVNKMGQSLCVPAGSTTCYQDVLITEEKDSFDPSSGLQTKAHAPGVGIVKIGAIGDPLGETLELTSFSRLDEASMEQARQTVLALDLRGSQIVPFYRDTPAAERPAPPPPPTEPAVQQPVVPPPTVTTVRVRVRVRSLSAARARATVSRALRQRLKGWHLAKVSCRTASRTRANCSFVATTRRGSRAGGFGTVTMRGGEGLVRYRLRARVVKGGCHPVASRGCTRRSVWASR
jgi:hypothetical protein